MKNKILKLSVAILLMNCHLAIGQKLSADSINSALNDKFDETKLPGVYPGIGIPDDYPYPTPPADPGGTGPRSINADISVEIKQDGMMLRQGCSDFFLVKYKIIAKNSMAEGAITFRVEENNTLGGANVQAVNVYPTDFITVQPEDSVILSGSLKLAYPYFVINTKNGAVKNYVSKKLSMNVKSVGGFKKQGNINYALDDPDHTNNQDVITVDTPLPSACIQTNPN